MASKNWAYTSFADDVSVRLDLNGVNYEVVEFTASWAINEVPSAVCLLAVGRNAFNVKRQAVAHASASGTKQMMRAKVFFTPVGQYTPDGKAWPKGEQMVFDGYFTGSGYQKVEGKVNFTVNLIHWLVDLSFSSCLSSRSHVSNPSNLAFSAIIDPVTAGGGPDQELAVWTSQYIGASALAELIPTDLWQALKTFFCGMSLFEGFSPQCGGAGIQNLAHNDRATRALLRIEGETLGASIKATTEDAPVDAVASPSGDCTRKYVYGKAIPLKLENADQAYEGVAKAMGQFALDSVWHTNMWDLLVGTFCPMFQLTLCPAVDRAIVAADTPGYNAALWQTVYPDEIAFVDQTLALPRPLRAVACWGLVEMTTNGLGGEVGMPTCMGGVFASDAGEDSDGVVLYAQIPEWIGAITDPVGETAGDATGTAKGVPINTATSITGGQPPTVPAAAAAAAAKAANTTLGEYAHGVFVREQLRGRNGTVSGKLRFDIGPGSHVRVAGSQEVFLGAEDSLAQDQFAQVNRVTVSISAESRTASTSFVLTHLRNAAENAAERTSVDKHPLYLDAVAVGLPLVDAYQFDAGSKKPK